MNSSRPGILLPCLRDLPSSSPALQVSVILPVTAARLVYASDQTPGVRRKPASVQHLSRHSEPRAAASPSPVQVLTVTHRLND